MAANIQALATLPVFATTFGDSVDGIINRGFQYAKPAPKKLITPEQLAKYTERNRLKKIPNSLTNGRVTVGDRTHSSATILNVEAEKIFSRGNSNGS